MTGAWATVANPPTQMLAQAAYDSGLVAGIHYSSAKHIGKKNVVVFPARLKAPAVDYLEIFDPNGNLTQKIGA